MAAGSTYTPIATTTLGSNQTSVTFNSFSGYTDIVIICSVKNTTVNWASPRLQFNSDTGSNYSNTYLTGNGTSATSGRSTNDNAIALGNIDNTYFTVVVANVQNYSNSTTYKTVISRIGTANNGTQAEVGMWRNTAAITSITIDAQVNQFASGSTFTLYGITAA